MKPKTKPNVETRYYFVTELQPKQFCVAEMMKCVDDRDRDPSTYQHVGLPNESSIKRLAKELLHDNDDGELDGMRLVEVTANKRDLRVTAIHKF